MIPPFLPSLWLQNGLLMTYYAAWKMSRLQLEELTYQEHIFIGAQGVPLFVKIAIPAKAKGTIIGTYGITGNLENQGMLKILASKAFHQGYAVVLFDWRAHGRTAELSNALTSDGLYEGEDFVLIAKSAQIEGCPPPFWLTGYSLGGQLALWGLKAAQEDLDNDIVGGAVICPSLDSDRSLNYLGSSLGGRLIEHLITQELKRLARRIEQLHPQTIPPEALERVESIRSFDQELVVRKLGFATAKEYYAATNTLKILPKLTLPTLIIYAADDPLFDPAIIPDLTEVAENNPYLELLLTAQGGHVGYINSDYGSKMSKDADYWWAWNRLLEWIVKKS